ncbi:MAG: ArsO family NAD(P)H-dependent flavin-containing monooxygenase [Candidatus Kapaibacteriales bacterium]
MYDCIVVGGGQAGLAAGYYLKRNKINFKIVDANESPGGSWLHTWDSLKLFSPSNTSSLPGMPMPESEGRFPTKYEVIRYFEKYEKRYGLPIDRPFKVENIHQNEMSSFSVHSDNNQVLDSKTLILATGTWSGYKIPEYDGLENYEGKNIHSAIFRSASDFVDGNTLVIGGGNSGAQIAAELSKNGNCTWATISEPVFMDKEIDGYKLFDLASQKYRASVRDDSSEKQTFLGNIVQVPEVKVALESRVYNIRRMPKRFTRKGVEWPDGSKEDFDSVIWCTGFEADLSIARKLIKDNGGTENQRINVDGQKSKDVKGLWLLGYGNWTGFASATLIGVGRTAKKAVSEIQDYLKVLNQPE